MNSAGGQGVALNRGDLRAGLDPVNFSFNPGSFNFSFSDINSNGVPLVIPSTNIIGRWVHVAGTIDGTSGQMDLYINGAVAASLVTPLRPIGALLPNQGPGLGIGTISLSPGRLMK
jgi:hypothetical protein